MLRRSAPFLLVFALACGGETAGGGDESDAGNSGGSDSGTTAIDGGARYHPAGFNDPAMHGPELKQGLQDCRNCHGTDLTGGLGPSCDGCHQAEWRTTCTYCHGGTDTDTGAPPRDLNGNTDRDSLSFRAHTEHTTVKNHQAYDCIHCHRKPENVLSENHIFDSTPGMREVDFAQGLSGDGHYDGNGMCSNLYCHGTGRSNGSYDHTRPEPDCQTCHPGPASSLTQLLAMSGRHRVHVQHNVQCYECHGETLAPDNTIMTPDLHVNGAKDLAFVAPGFARTNGRCSGTCHTERHLSRTW